MVSFPYYSHTTPIRIPKDMGIVWQAYHKGVPCPWGSLESPLNQGTSRDGCLKGKQIGKVSTGVDVSVCVLCPVSCGFVFLMIFDGFDPMG